MRDADSENPGPRNYDFRALNNMLTCLDGDGGTAAALYFPRGKVPLPEMDRPWNLIETSIGEII